MNYKLPCEICGIKIATQLHHRFPQYKHHRKLYGNLLDMPFNIQKVCVDCHLSGKIETWNEKQFREIAIHIGYIVPKGTKSYHQKWGI